MSAVNILMYGMTSKPDICYLAGFVSRYQANLGKEHWQAVKRIFKYLQGTKLMKLCFGLRELKVIGYCDTDFVDDHDYRKSTSDHVFIFTDGTDSWSSKHQLWVSRHKMKIKYAACSTVSIKAVYIKCFVENSNIGILEGPGLQLSLIKSIAICPKGKGINVSYHYMRNMVEIWKIKVDYIPSEKMIANPMTKGLSLENFYKACRKHEIEVHHLIWLLRN